MKYSSCLSYLRIIFLFFAVQPYLHAQNITLNPSNTAGAVPDSYRPGINYTPKTNAAAYYFLTNGITYNSVRLFEIERAMNYPGVNSIADVMLVLEALEPEISQTYLHCERLILPILKMPAWLSSSSDNSSIPGAGDPNWLYYNTVPPADYNVWGTLVDSIVDKISNQWGLDVHYEIWNEPDNFYWQGTPQEYFTFFKNTYSAIRSNHPTVKIGGPAVASFNSCFGFSLPQGHLDNAQFDQTIIAQLIDSCEIWNMPLDFISWHEFDPFPHSMAQEVTWLNQKLISSGHGVVPLIISEWNQTSDLRDTDFSIGFMTNYALSTLKYGITAQAVASWQDFDSSATEFHQDYGLLSWGALQKPAWKSLYLMNQLEGALIPIVLDDSTNMAVAAAVTNDTLRMLVSNYQLPAFVETIMYLYYEKLFNSNDFALENLTNEAHLDSIFKGLITLPVTSSLTSEINQAIPFYHVADSLYTEGRTINVTLSGIGGNHTGFFTFVDSSTNNVISVFDSLIADGYTREDAVNFLYPTTEIINSVPATFVDSLFSFHLPTNAVAFIEIYIPELNGLNINSYPSNSDGCFILYPNPVIQNELTIESKTITSEYRSATLLNSSGSIIDQIILVDGCANIPTAQLPSGIYYLRNDEFGCVQKFVKP